MKKKVLIAIAIITSCLGMISFYQPKDNALTQSEKKSGWELLFDGKTLNGWRMYQNKLTDCWGAKNGELYCKGSETNKTDLRTDIITAEQYGDFELSIDWKIAPESNSGIMYHVTEQYDVPYLSGPEYQIIDDIGFPEKLEDWQKTGADYAMYPASTRPTNPVGQYNTSRIIVKGAHREYWLNNVKVVDFEAWTPEWNKQKATGKWKNAPGYGIAKNGYICLQDHGGGVWFKNIKIRKL
jgi:hypothetical protein